MVEVVPDDRSPVRAARRLRVGWIEDGFRGDSKAAQAVTEDGTTWLIEEQRLTRVPRCGDMESWPLLTLDYLAVGYALEPVVRLANGAEQALLNCGVVERLLIENLPTR